MDLMSNSCRNNISEWNTWNVHTRYPDLLIDR